MAEEVKSSRGEDALPMKKAGSGMLIGAGVGVVVIGGLIAYAVAGGEPAPERAKATVQAETETQGMTKAELEERQAHLKKTQAALIAAAADDAEESQKAAQAEQAKQAEQTQEAESAEKKSTAASPAPKNTAKKPANSQKSLDGLDALGADITSQLK